MERLSKLLDWYPNFAYEGYQLYLFIFVTSFNIYSDLGAVGLSLQLHSCLLKSGYEMNSFIESAQIDLYIGFGMIHDAYGSFLGKEEKNVVFGTRFHDENIVVDGVLILCYNSVFWCFF